MSVEHGLEAADAPEFKMLKGAPLIILMMPGGVCVNEKGTQNSCGPGLFSALGQGPQATTTTPQLVPPCNC